MKTNYVLIDLENVQPKNLSLLKGHGFKVMVFVGSKQTKISFDLAVAMQGLGDEAEYVKIEGDGPNALDFHIAFYMGQLSAIDSNCYFHIISKDAGFDPLIRHLKARKIYAQREKDISEIPLLKVSNSRTLAEKVESVIVFLRGRGTAKPRKVSTLENSINTLFMKKLESEELKALTDELVRRKIVVKNGTSVSYDIPAES